MKRYFVVYNISDKVLFLNCIAELLTHEFEKNFIPALLQEVWEDAEQTLFVRNMSKVDIIIVSLTDITVSE